MIGEPGEHSQPRLGGGRPADRRGDRGRALALINDLVATAEGIPLLKANEVAVLQEGSPEPDGEPGADRRRHRPRHGLSAARRRPLGARPVRGGARRLSATDGGRDRSAPLSARAFRTGEQRAGGVRDRACSTSTTSCGTCGRCRRARGCAKRSAAGEDPARVIGEAAMASGSDGCGLCTRALDMLVVAYGALAGNLALLGTATGGVYLGGGIAPKILPRLVARIFPRRPSSPRGASSPISRRSPCG